MQNPHFIFTAPITAEEQAVGKVQQRRRLPLRHNMRPRHRESVQKSCGASNLQMLNRCWVLKMNEAAKEASCSSSSSFSCDMCPAFVLCSKRRLQALFSLRSKQLFASFSQLAHTTTATAVIIISVCCAHDDDHTTKWERVPQYATRSGIGQCSTTQYVKDDCSCAQRKLAEHGRVPRANRRIARRLSSRCGTGAFGQTRSYSETSRRAAQTDGGRKA